MKKIKLIQLLDSIGSKEFSRLSLFISSPYYNQNPTIIKLLAFIQLCYPNDLQNIADKQQLHQYLFPNQAFDDKVLRYAMSDFCKLIEMFFVVESLQKHPYQKELFLLEDLSERALEKQYLQQQEQTIALGNTLRMTIAEFPLFQLQLSKIQEKHFQRQRVRKYDDSVQRVVEHLDIYYYLERMKNSCAMLDRQHILQGNFELKLSPAWLQHLEQQYFFHSPTLETYHTTYQMLVDGSTESHFEKLKQLIHQYEDAINPFDKKEIYLLAINYCARKIRSGNVLYAKEAFDLYRMGIEHRILFEKGNLSPWTFTNVVKLALKLERHDWAEHFMNEYETFLPPNFRENCMHYNLSELYYTTNRLRLAQAHLHQVVHSDLHYYLGARLLLAKIYFETSEEEALLSLIAAFTIFLKRNNLVSKQIKEYYLNFCTLLLQIIKCNYKNHSMLQAKIEATTNLAEKTWLLESLEKKLF